jgi:hypothetical protein
MLPASDRDDFLKAEAKPERADKARSAVLTS